MKSDVTYDLLIIGGGISACVFKGNQMRRTDFPTEVVLTKRITGFESCPIHS